MDLAGLPRRVKNCLSLRVVLSYAHRDEKLREELNKHLSTLRRSATIKSWDDRKILPGSDFGAEIDLKLREAEIILLLVSSDFMNSDYCYCREMRLALRRHARRQARVIPIIMRPVDWLKTPIGGLLALPKDGKPVTTWHRRDEALLDITKGIRKVAEELTSSQSLPVRLKNRSRIGQPNV